MAEQQDSIRILLEKLGKLPGIGARSAERILFHILKEPEAEMIALANAISGVKLRVKPCSICFNLTEQHTCEICQDTRRDDTVICVIEKPRDLIMMENSGTFRGKYHVLMGEISPLDGIDESHLTLNGLIRRLQPSRGSSPAKPAVKEVILATNPTMDGDATALRIAEEIRQRAPHVVVTKLARGIAAGSSLEFANRNMLADAFTGRRKVD